MEDERIKLAQEIKGLSKIDAADRGYVKNIVLGIYQFDKYMPKLESEVYQTPDHYNVCIKGWTHSISQSQLYKKYLDEKNRATLYDPIIDIIVEPVTEDGTLVKVQIRRSSFTKDKKRK
jgi:hypothetical protein